MRVDIGHRFCCRIWLVKVKAFFWCKANYPASCSYSEIHKLSSSQPRTATVGGFCKDCSTPLSAAVASPPLFTSRRGNVGKAAETLRERERDPAKSVAVCMGHGMGSPARQVRDFPPLGVSEIRQRDLTKLVCHDVRGALF